MCSSGQILTGDCEIEGTASDTDVDEPLLGDPGADSDDVLSESLRLPSTPVMMVRLTSVPPDGTEGGQWVAEALVPDTSIDMAVGG